MDQFLHLDGYVSISTDRDYMEKTSTWKYMYRNYSHNIELQKDNFKTYQECLDDLSQEHQRITKGVK